MFNLFLSHVQYEFKFNIAIELAIFLLTQIRNNMYEKFAKNVKDFHIEMEWIEIHCATAIMDKNALLMAQKVLEMKLLHFSPLQAS